VTPAHKAASAPAAGRYASLTVVRDGDGYVLGSQRSPDYVAVPDIGGQVVRWLQDGTSLDECGRRAAELAGQPVDVAGFIDGLTQAGLLAADDQTADGQAEAGQAEAGQAEAGQAEAGQAEASLPVPAGVAGWKHAAGRVLFGPAGLAVQGLLGTIVVAAMIGLPRVRPAYADAIPATVPLVSIAVIAVLGIALGLAHEFAHVLAAWAAGVPSRVSVSRRMIAVVFQTDLTRLWSVPRRSRIVPLLAGIVFDAAAVGVLVVLEVTLPGAPPLFVHLIRAVVFLNVSAIAFQFLIFLRTDVYALFVLAAGCKHLWDVKGAISRKAVGRATAGDLALLDAVARREIFWAKVFLFLYAPGVLVTTGYFVIFALPAVRKIIAASLRAVFSDGLLSVTGAAGAIAFLLAVASTGYVLWGLARTLARICRQLISGSNPRPRRALRRS
jgi:putative peptide zinc metalloprotease protein